MSLAQILSCVLMSGGLVFIAIAALGVWKLPDFYSRLHASGIGETLGLLLFGCGLVVYNGISPASIKIILVILAVAIATPIGTHTIGRTAFRSGREIWTRSQEKKETEKKEKPLPSEAEKEARKKASAADACEKEEKTACRS